MQDTNKKASVMTSSVASSLLIDIPKAVELMKKGAPLIFPTETFYALGSKALSPEATVGVFRAKHRSSVKPLPIIIGSWAQLDDIAKVPDELMPLLRALWPGPLSVIIPARLRVPDVLTGGTNCVAVRFSSHPVACALAQALGEPITASSANISGTPAVVSIADLDPDLLRNVSGIVDGGEQPAGGLPSTLVELCGPKKLRILRKGATPKETLMAQGFTCIEIEDA